MLVSILLNKGLRDIWPRFGQLQVSGFVHDEGEKEFSVEEHCVMTMAPGGTLLLLCGWR